MWPEKLARLNRYLGNPIFAGSDIDYGPILDKRLDLMERFGKVPGVLIEEAGIISCVQPPAIGVNFIEGVPITEKLKAEIVESAKPHPVIFGLRSREIVEAYTPALGEEVRDDPFKDRLGADAIIIARCDEIMERFLCSEAIQGGGYHPHHDRPPELFVILRQNAALTDELKRSIEQIAHPYKVAFEERPAAVANPRGEGPDGARLWSRLRSMFGL